MPSGIIVFGANGSGKSTIGKALAHVLDFKHMDIEDYHFIKSKIPYTKIRTKTDCLSLMLKDIKKHNNFVISAVTGDFGNEIMAMYDLAVLVSAPLEIRIERVKERSYKKHGKRIANGGDMYKQQLKFIEFVKTRSLEKIIKWEKILKCPIISIDSTKPISDNINLIIYKYSCIMNI